jgi:hypothetical protein
MINKKPFQNERVFTKMEMIVNLVEDKYRAELRMQYCLVEDKALN